MTDLYMGTGVLFVKAAPPTPCIDDVDEWARNNSVNELTHNAWIDSAKASTHDGKPCIEFVICEGMKSDDYGEMHASALEVTGWIQTLMDDGWTVLDWEVHVEEDLE